MISSDLIASARKKDKKSLRILFEACYSFMKNISVRYSKNEAQSVELLNAGFYSIVNSLNQYDESLIDFQKWISNQFIQNCISFLKKNEKEYYVTTTAKPNDPDWEKSNLLSKIFLEDFNSIPDQLLIESIQEIPPSFRAIFNLHLIDGFSLEEASLMMEINIETCKRNLERGRTAFEKNIRSKVILQ